jgi:glutamine kinase
MVDDWTCMGTVPFSILARHGCIVKTILLSLNPRGVLADDEVNQILARVKTVAVELVDDMRSLQMGALSNSKFMAKYGHPLPGTYDIMSHRYDQMTDLIGTTASAPHSDHTLEPFEFS